MQTFFGASRCPPQNVIPYVPQATMRLIRWSLLTIFVISMTAAVIVRSTGYTGVVSESGRFFVTYRSSRYEVSREAYEQARWRNRVAATAAVTMMVALFAFIGIELVRLGGRHITTRCSGLAPRVRRLKLPVVSGRGPGH
jgi:hypothetical protein